MTPCEIFTNSSLQPVGQSTPGIDESNGKIKMPLLDLRGVVGVKYCSGTLSGTGPKLTSTHPFEEHARQTGYQ